MARTTALGAGEMTRAVLVGETIWSRLIEDGVDVADDFALRVAVDEAVGQYDMDARCEDVVYASVLMSREQELGWD